MSSTSLFAERIGGASFGQPGQIFKFTLIEMAKERFIAENPGVAVIDMGAGEPEELPPRAVIDTLSREAQLKENRYYPCNGILPFQEAAARYLQRLLRVTMNPRSEIMHCIGAKSALAQIPFAFLNPGDRVVVTVPGYPVLPKVAAWLGAELIKIPLYAANAFLPDLAQLEEVCRSRRPKLVLLNYPNNPTGGIATAEFYERIVDMAHRYSFVIVQDAAYSDMVYSAAYCSPLQVKGGREVTLEIYSLSKGYNMQGYRIGFVAGGAQLVKAYGLVKDNTDNGQFIAIQKAGACALDSCGSFLAYQSTKYLRRMRRVSEIVSTVGLNCSPSSGALYLYAPVPRELCGREIKSAQEASEILLSSFGLVTVPWDEAGAYVRLSMTFECGTPEFPTEEDVYRTLSERMRPAVVGGANSHGAAA